MECVFEVLLDNDALPYEDRRMWIAVSAHNPSSALKTFLANDGIKTVGEAFQVYVPFDNDAIDKRYYEQQRRNSDDGPFFYKR